jgi:hypothetical protein
MTARIDVCLFTGEIDLSEDAPLYKYLSTEAFLHLIEFRRLMFSRITGWPDSFEGSRFTFLSNTNMLTDFPGRTKDDFFAMCWSLQTEDPRLFTNSVDHKRAVQEIQNNGSAAMWESYCRNGGVRIATTIGKLDNLIKSKANECAVHRGRVYYEPTDSWTRTINAPTLVSTLLHKRVSFRYENEYRYILVPDRTTLDPFVTVEVDSIYQFLDEILVSPATSGNKWVSRALYHVGVDLTINRENNNANSKDGHQFCRISQLYSTIPQTIGYLDMR